MSTQTDIEALPKHDLYTDADKDLPKAICDSNGQVALGLCKRCGKGESELAEPCVAPTASAAPQQVTQPMDLHRLIVDVLTKHRMVNMYEMEDDGPGQNYPLIDRLSLDGCDISSGREEIDAIADAILDAIASTEEAEVAEIESLRSQNAEKDRQIEELIKLAVQLVIDVGLEGDLLERRELACKAIERLEEQG